MDFPGFRWGEHFLAFPDQPLFLVSLEQENSDFCVANCLALIDVSSGNVLASISFESPIVQLFRMDKDVFGVALDDDTVEAITICKGNL